VAQSIKEFCERISPSAETLEAKRLERNRKAKERAKAKRDALRSLGMVRGKDSMGKEIWE
jgi:hypothetical protein